VTWYAIATGGALGSLLSFHSGEQETASYAILQTLAKAERRRKERGKWLSGRSGMESKFMPTPGLHEDVTRLGGEALNK